MPQTFHVLLCCDCKTFQVHIVKKSSNKWDCKICNKKQSVQQVYAKGTGFECREVVQQLNLARGKLEENQEAPFAQYQQETENTASDSIGIHDPSHSQQSSSGIRNIPPDQSKWSVFLQDN